MTTASPLDALQALAADATLADLDTYVPPLRLFEALGVARDELSHSRLLATLLDPRRHKWAKHILRALLRQLSAPLEQCRPDTASRFAQIISADWTEVAVRRELQRIDLVIEITSPDDSAAIGIENKIDAGEQPNQIRRYQEALRKLYPQRVVVLVFLTPTRRCPSTACPDDSVPCLPVGYEAVLAAIEAAQQKADSGNPDTQALAEIVTHLKEEILGPSEIKSRVHELWKTHARALQLALKYRPRLADVREHYEQALKAHFNADARFSYHPSERGEPREIKMELSSWWEKGFPFTFRLSADPDESPNVRLLIWKDHYADRMSPLVSWVQKVNAALGPLVDESFVHLQGSGWRCVLQGEKKSAAAVLDEQAFDVKTAKDAVERVINLFDQLSPYIEWTG